MQQIIVSDDVAALNTLLKNPTLASMPLTARHSRINQQQRVPFAGQPPSVSAPSQYGAVGFSYGAGPRNRSSSSDSDSDASSVSSEEDRDDEDLRKDRAADNLAANVGIEHFSLMLRRAEQQEEDEALGRAPRKR